MNDRFRFRSHLRLIDLPEERTALVSGEQAVLVFSGTHGWLIRHLYESFSQNVKFGSAVECLERHEQFQARELLHFLLGEGALVDGDTLPKSSFEEYKDLVVGDNVPSAKALQIVSKSAVGIALESCLADVGYEIISGVEGQTAADLCFVDCTSIGFRRTREINDRCLKSGICCLYTYRSSVNETVIGPLVIPGVTACLECFLGRWIANASYISDAILRGPEEVRKISGPTALDQAAASALGLQTIQHLDHTAAPATWNGVIILDHQRGTSVRHHVLKVPHCNSCALAGA